MAVRKQVANVIALAGDTLYNLSWPIEGARKLGFKESLSILPN